MILTNKTVKNASWMIGCRIVQSVLNLIVGMFTARYLGPSGYGIIAYATAVVAFALPLVHLGFKSILVQEVLEAPENEGTVLGSAVLTSVASSFVCMIGIAAFVLVVNSGNTETLTVCCLYSTVLVFQACELLQYWFQAKLLSKYPSIIMLIAYVAVSAYKIFLLATQKSIQWFALSNAIDAALIALGMFVVYRRLGGSKLKFSAQTVSELFTRSKYYILPALMVVVLQQSDRIFLKEFLNETSTGIYSAAVSSVGITAFVYSAIIESAQPTILQAHMKSHEDFEHKMTFLYSLLFYLSVLQCVVFTTLAKPIVLILYGSEYSAAVPVLRVATWYIPFSYMNSAQHIWILAENKQKYLWILSLSGMICNVMVNILLIPIFGEMGAAIAMVASQLIKLFVINLFIPKLRRNLYLVFRGMSPLTLVNSVNHFLRKSK